MTEGFCFWAHDLLASDCAGLALVLDRLPRVAHRDEPMLIPTRIPKSAAEAFDISVLLRFARLGEAQLQTVAASPFAECLAD
jgi:hypothetical protein